MAQRRMFSQKIVASDAFLEMPTSSRELYFQLGMYADDDGFINPKKIMRMIGASEDDLKVLLGKRFVIAFDNGVVVIKHWKINNLIRKDFYEETIYTEQKNLLNTKENKSYTENQQIVNNPVTQVSIGKVSTVQDSIEKTQTPAEQARKFFADIGEQNKIIEEFAKNGMPADLVRTEIRKFVLYWTELNKSGTRQRWELERTFEVSRRLGTWLRNYIGFNKTSNPSAIKI